MAETSKTQPTGLTLSPKALNKALAQSALQARRMAETGYKPVPHDAAFRKALLAKPGAQSAFDALEEEYTALHAMLDARQAAELTKADVASRIGTTVSAVSRLEAPLRSEKHSPSFATLRKRAARN